MRIGMVSQWYEPEPGAAAHPAAIARALHRRGHELRVLTGIPSYPMGQYYKDYRLKFRQREERDGVHLLRVPGFPSHDKSGARRALTLSTFAASATLQAGWLKGVDVCLVYLTPATVGMAGWVLRRVAGVPYVLYVQDLWPESVTASGLIRNDLVHRWVQKAINTYLRGLYGHAAAVAVISPSMATMLGGRGVKGQALVVPNWVDEEIFHPVQSSARGTHAYGFRIMYAGGIGDVQGLDAAVRALALLDDRPDIRLALVGDGVAVPSLQQLANDLNVRDRIQFLGWKPTSEMPGLMAQADVQLVSLQDLPLFRGTIPSKLQSSMACGQPVICAVAGDAQALMTASGAGLWVNPGDPRALAQAFRSIADATPTERSAMGDRGYDYYVRHLGEQIGCVNLERLLTSAAGSPR